MGVAVMGSGRGDLRLAQDRRPDAQNPLPRQREGGLDVYLRRGGLQPDSNATLGARGVTSRAQVRPLNAFPLLQAPKQG